MTPLFSPPDSLPVATRKAFFLVIHRIGLPTIGRVYRYTIGLSCKVTVVLPSRSLQSDRGCPCKVTVDNSFNPSLFALMLDHVGGAALYGRGAMPEGHAPSVYVDPCACILAMNLPQRPQEDRLEIVHPAISANRTAP